MGPYKWGHSETRICNVKIGARKCFIAGVLLMAAGGSLTAIATIYKSIVLLFVGCGPLFGSGMGLIFPVVRSVPMLFFASPAVNLRGLGAGITGSAPGLWAASFSFWGLALSNAIGIGDAIFVAVAIMAALAVVPLPFIYVKPPACDTPTAAAVRTSSNAGRDVPQLSYSQILKIPQFWLFNIAMYCQRVARPVIVVIYCTQ